VDEHLLNREELIEKGYDYDDLEMVPSSDQLFVRTGEEGDDLVPVDGLVYELSEGDGSLLYYGQFENGLPNGISVFFHSNGQMKSMGTIFHGTGHGWSRLWDEQGKLIFLGEYLHGISVRFREWDGSGNMIDEKMAPNETERSIIDQRMMAAKKNWPDEASGLSYDFLENKGWPES